jgi:hypothetical protein
MARTPLAARLAEAASVASEAAGRNAPVDEVLEDRAGQLRRRELLVGGAGIAMAAVLGGQLPRAIAAGAPRIVVVGGGWRD